MKYRVVAMTYSGEYGCYTAINEYDRYMTDNIAIAKDMTAVYSKMEEQQKNEWCSNVKRVDIEVIDEDTGEVVYEKTAFER